MPETFELEFIPISDSAGVPELGISSRRYVVRDADGAHGEVVIPWDKLIDDLAALRDPGRDPAVLGRVGELLREAVKAVWWDVIERAVQNASKCRTRVHVVIRSEAPEIFALPWELLCMKPSRETLGASRGALVRYQGGSKRGLPQNGARGGRGRILIATSAGGGGVPAREHIEAIGDALRDAGGSSPKVLSSATLDSIETELKQAKESGEPFECLHILCHGVRRGSAYGLALSGADIEATHLRDRLRPFADALRLVVVAACDSANVGLVGAAVTSVTHLLHSLGIGAVIGSRFPLSVDGSTKMTEALYRAILVGRKEIEEAFIAAREALWDPKSDEWATLQLLWRGDDLQLWRFWSSPRNFEAELRAILEKNVGARAFTASVAHFLDIDPDVSRVAQELVQRTATAGLGAVCGPIDYALSRLKVARHPHLEAAAVAACGVIEHIAPTDPGYSALSRIDALGVVHVDIGTAAGADALVGALGSHQAFLRLCGEDLVGKGLIEEPVHGLDLYQGTTLAERFVAFLAGHFGLPEDVEAYEDGMQGLKEYVDAELAAARARASDGTPALGFLPRYVGIAGEPRVLDDCVRRELTSMLENIQIVVRRVKMSPLDMAFRRVVKVYKLREELREKQ